MKTDVTRGQYKALKYLITYTDNSRISSMIYIGIPDMLMSEYFSSVAMVSRRFPEQSCDRFPPTWEGARQELHQAATYNRDLARYEEINVEVTYLFWVKLPHPIQVMVSEYITETTPIPFAEREVRQYLHNMYTIGCRYPGEESNMRSLLPDDVDETAAITRERWAHTIIDHIWSLGDGNTFEGDLRYLKYKNTLNKGESDA